MRHFQGFSILCIIPCDSICLFASSFFFFLNKFQNILTPPLSLTLLRIDIFLFLLQKYIHQICIHRQSFLTIIFYVILIIFSICADGISVAIYTPNSCCSNTNSVSFISNISYLPCSIKYSIIMPNLLL